MALSATSRRLFFRSIGSAAVSSTLLESAPKTPAAARHLEVVAEGESLATGVCPYPINKSPRRRGDSSPQTAEVRVVMRDGEILQPGTMRKILHQNPSPIPRSESNLMERYRRLAGVPAKTNPGAIERNRPGRDLDNR